MGLVEGLVEELDVPGGELKGLDLGELVARQCRDDVAQGGEGLVQRLGALTLAHVRHDALLLHVAVVVAGGGVQVEWRVGRLVAQDVLVEDVLVEVGAVALVGGDGPRRADGRVAGGGERLETAVGQVTGLLWLLGGALAFGRLCRRVERVLGGRAA